jgi:predicted alpha/beta-fold hydrolase
MGANMLTKYLGMAGSSAVGLASGTPLTAAVAVSNAFCFQSLCASLERPMNNLLYSRPLAFMLRSTIVAPNKDMLAQVCDVNSALSARTIKQIDDRLCRHCYGLDSVDKYYEVSSSLPHLTSVRVPLLCLNAKDDPFKGTIPYEAVASNAHVMLAVTVVLYSFYFFNVVLLLILNIFINLNLIIIVTFICFSFSISSPLSS